MNETMFDRGPDLRWLHLANALAYSGLERLAAAAMLALYLHTPYTNAALN